MKEPSDIERGAAQGRESPQSSTNMEKSPETKAIRKEMHDAIVKGDLGEVERCLEENKVLKQWLDPETEKSAICKAAEVGQSKIRALLVYRNCRTNKENGVEQLEQVWDPKDLLKAKDIEELQHLKDIEYRYQLGCFAPKCGHIPHLVSNSSGIPRCGYPERKAIERYYEALEKIAMVDTSLQVAATRWLDVCFDFQRENCACVMGDKCSNARGVTFPREGRIYLGAKREERDLLGTMAHEFCHFALAVVYGNDAKPYRREDVERRRRYQAILNEIKSRKHDVHDVIQRAFDKSSVEEQELVVRIPHVLAMQFERRGTSGTEDVAGTMSGEELLQKQVPQLLQFYKEFVIPDMKKFIEKNRLGNDEEQIREQNVRLRKAERARKLGIEFKTKYELRDEPLVVLTAPNLSFLEAKINDAVSLTGKSYVFLDTNDWDSELKDVLWTYKCHYVVLSSGNGYYRKKKLRTQMQDVLKKLTRARGTRVIVLTEKAEQDQFAKDIRECFGNNVEFTPVPNCGLDDVTDECKAKVWRSSSVFLQDDVELQLDVQVPETAGGVLNALDESEFLKLCRDKEIDVGPKLQKLNENIARCYVERTCKRATQVDLHAALREVADEAFAIVGFRRRKLRNFIPRGCHACHYSAVKQFERCVLLSKANDYDALTRRTFYEDRTIHLLQYDSQRSEFHWVRSNGSLERLLNVTSGAGEIRGIEALLRDVPGKVMVICGDPGMGKSVMSLRMAQDIKARDKMTWVLQVDLSTKIGTMHMKFPNTELSTGKESMLAALCDIKEGTFEFNLLKRSISGAMPLKVVVMFDAFDEVNAENHEHLVQLALALSRSEISKILVFSRNISKLALQDKFSTIAVELVGFNDEEQLQFLEKYLKYDN